MHALTASSTALGGCRPFLPAQHLSLCCKSFLFSCTQQPQSSLLCPGTNCCCDLCCLLLLLLTPPLHATTAAVTAVAFASRRPVDVYHVTPGFDTVEQVQKQFPKFNPETDYFYNQFTVSGCDVCWLPLIGLPPHVSVRKHTLYAAGRQDASRQ